MHSNTDKFIFGPVPSRRLGISLGVDIVPFKTCTLDCVYCECGKTTRLSDLRERFVSAEQILAELEQHLSHETELDYITFSGSGEPTLNSDIGKIIRGIRQRSDKAIAVLTNGTLLSDPQVRADLTEADLVLPSIDAVSEDVFMQINRPCANIRLKEMLEGLTIFRNQFSGEIWLEVFIAAGYNDMESELTALQKTLKRISPDKIQLNTLDRPPAYESVHGVTLAQLEAIQEAWQDLPVEIIKRIRKRDEIKAFSKNLENSILNTINRRPLTIDDLAELTGKKHSELYKYIDILIKEKKIREQIINDRIFLIPFGKVSQV